LVDFVWADTQGAEGDLIKGGINTLNKSRYFFTEYGFKELYDGQISLEEIDLLLQNFSASRIFFMDALFENIELKKLEFMQEFEIPKVARNSRCLCGSGKRYKECHGTIT
jgi:hypothetical protein